MAVALYKNLYSAKSWWANNSRPWTPKRKLRMQPSKYQDDGVDMIEMNCEIFYDKVATVYIFDSDKAVIILDSLIVTFVNIKI